MTPDVQRLAGAVSAARAAYRLPVRAEAEAGEIVDLALALLFPHFAPDPKSDPAGVRAEIGRLEGSLQCFLAGLGPGGHRLDPPLAEGLPAIRQELLMDAEATYDADPAATSVDEVILAYPGFYALACYRLARHLRNLGVPLLPRLITERAHRVTGIDIHPGASIGRAIAIDHGTGIVIGETSVIGDRVRLYQGVTLGALSVRKDLARTRRHPTIEDDVVIYANATILGGDTVVGHSSVIGGNVWLTHSVPPHSIVTNVAVSERHDAATGTPLAAEL
jgi:serine O-acetyltransferase